MPVFVTAHDRRVGIPHLEIWPRPIVAGAAPTLPFFKQRRCSGCDVKTRLVVSYAATSMALGQTDIVTTIPISAHSRHLPAGAVVNGTGNEIYLVYGRA